MSRKSIDRYKASSFKFYTAEQTEKMLVDMGWDVVHCERLNWCFFGIVAVYNKFTPRNQVLQ